MKEEILKAVKKYADKKMKLYLLLVKNELILQYDASSLEKIAITSIPTANY